MSHLKILASGVITESVAKMLIINERHQALVMTIGEYEAHPEKSYTPDLPGGQVEIGNGESELAGAVREAEEEAGIVLNPQDVFLAYSKTKFFEAENKSVSKFLYVARLDHTPEVVISWEHSDHEWVAVEDLLTAKKFSSFYAEAIEYATTNKLV